MRFLVTGAAGFIGFHLSKRLLQEGHTVLGYDGMTEYYDLRLKSDRLSMLLEEASFSFVQAMLEDKASLEDVFTDFQPEGVVHLAGQAGVRYSLEQPRSYISSNVVGTHNLLEACRRVPPQHLMIASTSSVYGANPESPFREIDRTDFPVSLYAATKKACEAMAHSYAHLFQIPTTCFRFFTVYGPWGRPDMALFKFVKAMVDELPIEVYGQGHMMRDFTYIDDLVTGIVNLARVMPAAAEACAVFDSVSPVAPFRTVNLAGGNPVSLTDFILAIESAMGFEARKSYLPIQPGDVTATHADPQLLDRLEIPLPKTPLVEGVAEFVHWFLEYYGDSSLRS